MAKLLNRMAHIGGLWLLVLSLGGWADVGSAESLAYHEQGRKLYNYRCYYCHGYSGDAKTLAASFMQPPPRNFTATSPATLSREQMIKAVTEGRAGTAMTSFTQYLSSQEIAQVVDFVRREFMQLRRENTRYHTEENGWPNHQRYRAAYPFALGEVALDTPQEQLSEAQRQGYRLFMSSCVSCHDRATVNDEGGIWRARAVSFPRNNFSYSELSKELDGVSGASVYAKHEVAPAVAVADEQLLEGERLFQANCAFCHGADGSGKNWIGSFLESAPRDLSDPAYINALGVDGVKRAIRDGLPNTSMPAWRSVLSEPQVASVAVYVVEVLAKPEAP